VSEHRPAPGLIPYTVNAALWSDGADKERFIALPGDSRIDFTGERGWNFADGAVLVKTFSLLLRDKDSSSRRRIETRLLTRQDGKWAGYSYLWNDEQSDATLVAAGGLDRVYAVADAAAPGGQRQQPWHYPSRAECIICHSRAANFVLGLNVLQMNRDHDYGGVADNQLRALEHAGIVRASRLEHFLELKRQVPGLSSALKLIGMLPGGQGFARRLNDALENTEIWLRQEPTYTDFLPKRPEQYARLVNPYDVREDLTQRVRSYLHSNCAQCHVTAGGGNAAIDLEFGTALGKTRLIGVRPQHQTFDIADPQLVAPGSPERSVLYQRLTRRGPGQMPPLATSVVDRQAAQLLREWIAALEPPRTGR
jgi:mono/diheme cytochrome c family protein